jgi:hypothetical protein
MQGRAYLDLAREVFNGGDEVHWRGTTVHAYYGLILECREALRRWGVVIPHGQSMHSFVRIRFLRARDADLNRIADELDWLVRRRNSASYELNPAPWFTNDREAREALNRAPAALALLNAIEADPTRRANAVASLPP